MFQIICEMLYEENGHLRAEIVSWKTVLLEDVLIDGNSKSSLGE